MSHSGQGDFLGDDFLLSGKTARRLFHDVADPCPIVDLHNHLSAKDICSDRVYATLTDLWLEDDHYKWRAMRSAGIDEALITGDADPWERFSAWATTVPRLVRSPMFVWTHLELRRVFGIDLLLTPETSREIWEEADRQLPQWPARRLLSHFDVRIVATTDDPADDLSDHGRLAESRTEKEPVVIPTFRPDAAHRMLVEPVGWREWAQRLGMLSGFAVEDLDSLLAALEVSWRRFSSLGARASDHGIERLPDRPRDPDLANLAVLRACDGTVPDLAGREAVLSEVLALSARLAFEEDAVLQLHLGAARDTSPRVFARLGRDAGGDAVGDERHGPGLVRLLASLEAGNGLPRTVLYNANPTDNELFATVAGAFSRAGIDTLVQWGPAWWFNDHERGMRRQLDVLSESGLLAGYMGMVADSRSLLSMSRHELFRRVLCDEIGRDAENGRIPCDLDGLAGLVRNICVSNAVRYFGVTYSP
jgi:glucuronate isomerase